VKAHARTILVATLLTSACATAPRKRAGEQAPSAAAAAPDCREVLIRSVKDSGGGPVAIYVSMANNAGRHARQVVANIETVVGIELLMAAQALELRMAERQATSEALSPASRAALDLLRSTTSADGRRIDHITRDVVMYPRVRRAVELVHHGDVVAAVNEVAPAS